MTTYRSFDELLQALQKIVEEVEVVEWNVTDLVTFAGERVDVELERAMTAEALGSPAVTIDWFLDRARHREDVATGEVGTDWPLRACRIARIDIRVGLADGKAE